MFDESELDILDSVIDWAHRIGSEYSDYKTKRKCKVIFVIFTTFRHKTLVYRARKKIRSNVKIRLNLTKERHALLFEANDLVLLNLITMLSLVLLKLIIAWNSNERMNYGQIVFSLHWKIKKENCRLIKITTFFFKFVVSFFGFIVGFLFVSYSYLR